MNYVNWLTIEFVALVLDVELWTAVGCILPSAIKYRAAKSHGLAVSFQVFALISRSHGWSWKSHGFYGFLMVKWSFMHGLIAPDQPVCWANKASRAILSYYKEKWDKLWQFCEKLRKFRGKFCDIWKFCIMSEKIFSAVYFPYKYTIFVREIQYL
jgi:hypothetical protein